MCSSDLAPTIKPHNYYFRGVGTEDEARELQASRSDKEFWSHFPGRLRSGSDDMSRSSIASRTKYRFSHMDFFPEGEPYWLSSEDVPSPRPSDSADMFEASPAVDVVGKPMSSTWFPQRHWFDPDREAELPNSITDPVFDDIALRRKPHADRKSTRLNSSH